MEVMRVEQVMMETEKALPVKHTHLCTDQETQSTVSDAAAESMKMVESPITKRSSKTFQSADSVL